jgi:DNA binding domain, excisionase family
MDRKGGRGVTLLTKKEVAAMLKCSVSKIEKMMKAGEIGYKKIGSLVRFRPSDLEPFFEVSTLFPTTITVRKTFVDGVEIPSSYENGRIRP